MIVYKEHHLLSKLGLTINISSVDKYCVVLGSMTGGGGCDVEGWVGCTSAEILGLSLTGADGISLFSTDNKCCE